MLRALGTVFAALLGLAFGSFLNVCLSRWPEGESVVAPRSHCRTCERTLHWCENVPLISWLALRGRCRGCGKRIGVRYPLVEAAVGGLWALLAWQSFPTANDAVMAPATISFIAVSSLSLMVFMWLMVALGALDAEHLWLPDWLTWPGIGIGIALQFVLMGVGEELPDSTHQPIALFPRYAQGGSVLSWSPPFLAPLAAAGLILLIRWVYWLVRRREGMGLGDAKLMALLAAWLGLPGALLAFALGVVLGALTAVGMLIVPRARREEGWTAVRLPLGTFLCVGGIVSALWGPLMIEAYLRFAGF